MKINFIVNAKAGKSIKKEFEWNGPKPGYTFEVRKEEDGDWMYITIENFSNMDALVIFHAGIEAGINQEKQLAKTYKSK